MFTLHLARPTQCSHSPDNTHQELAEAELAGFSWEVLLPTGRPRDLGLWIKSCGSMPLQKQTAPTTSSLQAPLLPFPLSPSCAVQSALPVFSCAVNRSCGTSFQNTNLITFSMIIYFHSLSWIHALLANLPFYHGSYLFNCYVTVQILLAYPR